jgi:predicted RNA-binding protein YlqC (UPF0109 family)
MSAEIEQLTELVRFVSKALVDLPDEVEVEAQEEDRAIVVELSVAETDLGKVIGKEGRTARAMRSILAAASARQDRRAILEILE